MADDEPLDLSELHDARFTTLDLDWDSGTVRLYFEIDDGSSRLPIGGGPTHFEPTRPGSAAVTITGLRELRVSRFLDWGPSVYVDEARWAARPDENGSSTLEIQMQSGDLLVVVGQTFEAARS